jgi:uncharacterized repeat protein (TIGR03843 family)
VLPAVPVAVEPEEALRLLGAATDLRPIGRLAEASNATFLCELIGVEPALQVVYKPIRGEAPLWDFPTGTLAGREVAAAMLSTALGLDVVPPTIMRPGPAGPGAVQLWIEHEGVQAAIDLVNADDARLRPIALFDAIVNNGDRKAGHLLPLADGRVLGVDHGVTFAVAPKLRTVLWAWRGDPFSTAEIAVLDRGIAALDSAVETSEGVAALRDGLSTHLDDTEIHALADRMRTLRVTGRFPQPGDEWPPLPWPLV